jgi:hypothetical protein
MTACLMGLDDFCRSTEECAHGPAPKLPAGALILGRYEDGSTLAFIRLSGARELGSVAVWKAYEPVQLPGIVLTSEQIKQILESFMDKGGAA